MRKSNDRIICGVCGGIAEYLDVSSFLVRFVFVCSGVGIEAFTCSWQSS
ncbi:MAG: PspC domain-containing protein [Bacteroidales bacterium]|nr:PspC domain-containing protein [Candidatus Cryptobacteroides choladohippi]